jgi:hypothetical protein
MKYELKRLAFAAPRKWLGEVVKTTRKAGYAVDANWREGVVEAYLDGDLIFRAFEIKKGFWYTSGASEVFKTEYKPEKRYD